MENQKDRKLKFIAVIEILNIFRVNLMVTAKKMALSIKKVSLQTPYQSRLTEKKVRTLVKMINTMIWNVKLSPIYGVNHYLLLIMCIIK